MRTADGDVTTERIRAEALKLFVQRGYGNTTIEHISTAANVGVATIYRRWPDKAAIANQLYGAGVDSMLSILDERPAEDDRAEFIALWGRAWEWANTNRNLFLFINASANAPWLTEENATRKAEASARELETYARLKIDATPDFAVALIGGTIGSVLMAEPDIDPDEVAERLWRALALGSG
ncbi:MAG: TetR/AcrR family transcriptional regulator [Actinomycetota bacterium]